MIMLPVPQPQTSSNRPPKGSPLQSSTCKLNRGVAGRQSLARQERRVSEPQSIQLDFSDRIAFDLVRDQYRHLGLQVEGAIAIQPSNPAFSACSGSLVLMPTAGNSAITLHYNLAARSVDVRVIAARQVSMTAFDRNGKRLGEKIVGSHQYLQQEPQQADPLCSHSLEIRKEGIVKIVLDSDAPFIVDSLAVRF